MKQKSQNRFFAALLAVAMMLQMLPMLAFADGAPGTPVAWNKKKNKSYTSLVDAVKEADSGDTIILGEGNYTLYGIKSDDMTKGKNLTFVGQGPDVTAWNIGAEVPDPKNYGTEYNGDYSFDGAGKITFKNMTLRSGGKGDKNYLGFIRPDQTVVDHCVINGKTFYWGYTSAVFTDTTFNAPSEDYAIWTYSSPTMIFDNCTFNTTGKAINVYADYEAGKHNVRVYFNNCTVNSSILNKQALNINDSNMRPYKYIIHIDNPQTIDAALSNTTCSQLFGFKEDKSTGFTGNTGYTDVYLGGDLVWTNGKMKTHSYTVGEKEDAYEITGRSDWTPSVERVDECEVTKTCKYCGWTKKELEHASVYRLQYNLNEGVDDETAYKDAYSREKESVKLAAAPTREGYQFAGWLSQNGKLYKAESELEFCKKMYKNHAINIKNMNTVKSVILDISGGGIRFSLSTPLEEGTYFMAQFSLALEECTQQFNIVCKVINCTQSLDYADRYFARSKFIFDRMTEREKIVRFVFEEERRIRRREME